MLKALTFGLVIASLAATGCSKQAGEGQNQAAAGASAVQTVQYILQTEPADAKGVAETGEKAKNDEEVVVVGRIGGSVNPWVEGAAAFDIVDLKLQPCNAEEGCPTPWDYCCDTNDLPKSTLTVKLVDDQGSPIKTDARELLGVKELQTVVVRGKVKKTDDSLVVLASGIFIKK